MRMTPEEYAAFQARAKELSKAHTIKKVHGNNKYGAVKTQVDGITFDSKGEAGRYIELKAEESAGLIQDLRLQVRFPLVVRGDYGTVEREYRADFVYIRDGQRVVEDYKGARSVRTREYIFKKDLMRALYGIEIEETYANRNTQKR